MNQALAGERNSSRIPIQRNGRGQALAWNRPSLSERWLATSSTAPSAGTRSAPRTWGANSTRTSTLTAPSTIARVNPGRHLRARPWSAASRSLMRGPLAASWRLIRPASVRVQVGTRGLLLLAHAVAVHRGAIEPVHCIDREPRADDARAALEVDFAAERHHDQAAEHHGSRYHEAHADHRPGRSLAPPILLGGW